MGPMQVAGGLEGSQIAPGRGRRASEATRKIRDVDEARAGEEVEDAGPAFRARVAHVEQSR
jgi:hypothetical protein